MFPGFCCLCVFRHLWGKTIFTFPLISILISWNSIQDLAEMSPLLVNLFLYLPRYLWPHSVLCPLYFRINCTVHVCIAPHASVKVLRAGRAKFACLCFYPRVAHVAVLSDYLCDGWTDSFYPPVQARYNSSGDVKDKHHQVTHTLCSSDQGFESHQLYPLLTQAIKRNDHQV